MRKHLGLLRLLVVSTTVLWGAMQGFGQSTAPQPKPNTRTNTPPPQAVAPVPQDKIWVKDPNTVMPMRKMTMGERHAAAQRNRDRRAQADTQQKQNTPSNQGVR